MCLTLCNNKFLMGLDIVCSSPMLLFPLMIFVCTVVLLTAWQFHYQKVYTCKLFHDYTASFHSRIVDCFICFSGFWCIIEIVRKPSNVCLFGRNIWTLNYMMTEKKIILEKKCLSITNWKNYRHLVVYICLLIIQLFNKTIVTWSLLHLYSTILFFSKKHLTSNYLLHT